MVSRVKILRSRHAVLFLSLVPAVFFCAAFFCVAAFPDEPTGDIVGPIEGEAIAVTGPMNVEVVRGQINTILRSGSDVVVKSGKARINLVEGGQIAICGPAHFSILKSGGSMTIALNSGTIHVHLEHELALTIYTAQIQAKPIAIGDGGQDVLVGLEAAGAMCVRAKTGAVRVEQQLAAQSIIVPENADILLSNGQFDSLRSGVGHCVCDLQMAKVVPQAPPPSATAQRTPSSAPEISTLATPEELRNREESAAKPAPAPAPPKPATKEQPVYQVFMPPLSYDANAKVQRDNFDPKLILLVRRVRVRPTLIFQGRVEDDPVVAQNPAPADKAGSSPPVESAKPAPQAKPEKPAAEDSLISRVRAFFHRLWSRFS